LARKGQSWVEIFPLVYKNQSRKKVKEWGDGLRRGDMHLILKLVSLPIQSGSGGRGASEGGSRKKRVRAKQHLGWGETWPPQIGTLLNEG